MRAFRSVCRTAMPARSARDASCVVPFALRAHALWKSYAAGVVGCSARAWVLRGASLEVHEGECVAILGARGAGTTTLLQCLAGLRRIDAGTIEHRRRPLLISRCDSSLMQGSALHRGAVLMFDDTNADGRATRPNIVREPVERGAATIVATHELSHLRHVVHRALLLRDGRLTALPLHSGSRRVAERSAAQASDVVSASMPPRVGEGS
jgi:ABC-type polar amino acid transport system ATPase subunit